MESSISLYLMLLFRFLHTQRSCVIWRCLPPYMSVYQCEIIGFVLVVACKATILHTNKNNAVLLLGGLVDIYQVTLSWRYWRMENGRGSMLWVSLVSLQIGVWPLLVYRGADRWYALLMALSPRESRFDGVLVYFALGFCNLQVLAGVSTCRRNLVVRLLFVPQSPVGLD